MRDDALASWYWAHGRHALPWRHTREPWAVLVSEVMLQQTSVARVLSRWHTFLGRWPDPAACAAAPLEEVLRMWQGLGYPRRARALHLSARAIAERGWPEDESGLRSLPGVGIYTAAALGRLAFGWNTPMPRDVNIDRVAARALLGTETDQTTPGQRARALTTVASRLDARHAVFALFDLGALVCTARTPGCARCPIRTECASAHRLTTAAAPARDRRHPAWRGSLRELRGTVLRELLGPRPPGSMAGLAERVGHLGAAGDGEGVRRAVDGLRHDGLLPAAALGSATGPLVPVAGTVLPAHPPGTLGDNVTPSLPPVAPVSSYHPPVADIDAQRILIVDDDAGVRGYLRAALGRTGHEVVEAGTAAAAIATIDAGPVGVMLIDGLLPDGHGLDLAAQVLERPDGALVGISFVTGAVREPVPPTDGIGALGKPVRPSELVAGVTELLAWRARGRGAGARSRRAALDNLAARFLVGR